MVESASDDIFTILYEVNGQKYVIGVTNEADPQIASMGVNTPRPLPKNMRDALVTMVKEAKNLDHDPKLIDFNSPTSHASETLFGNYSVTPISTFGTSKSVEEVLGELEKRLKKKSSKEEG